MDPDAVDELSGTAGQDSDGHGKTEANRVQHGGTTDPWLLDFSANINPRSPDGVSRVYESALSASRSYPADDYLSFRAAAAEYAGCDAAQVVPTAGAVSALRLAVATTVSSGDDVLVPSPSFGEYRREVRLQGADPTFVPHTQALGADPGQYDLVVACSPNNPTGDAYGADELRAYADRCRDAETPLLLDEAFIGFTDLESLAGTPGVLAVRSLTKLFGFPGLRAGFVVATGRHRDRLDTARLAWGIGTPAAAVGEYCMGQPSFVAETRDRVRTERDRMRDRLADRFRVYPSDAPFLLLEVPESVDDLLASVREADIVVRDARTFRGLDSHVRVAVRLPYENDLLLDALDV